MTAPLSNALVGCWLVLLVGCGETGQDLVTFPVHAAGTGEVTLESRDGWNVTLERADVGFGRMYLCATSFADLDVCPQAEAELLETATVDALDATPQMLGDAHGITATVRSAMFDYGIGWGITDGRARVAEGAPEGRSAIFVARAVRGADTLVVRAEVELAPRMAGFSAVIGAPTSTHTITGEESLTLRFDPAAWWASVLVDPLFAMDTDGDGEVSVGPGDPAHDALVVSMSSAALPTFEWQE